MEKGHSMPLARAAGSGGASRPRRCPHHERRRRDFNVRVDNSGDDSDSSPAATLLGPHYRLYYQQMPTVALPTKQSSVTQTTVVVRLLYRYCVGVPCRGGAVRCRSAASARARRWGRLLGTRHAYGKHRSVALKWCHAALPVDESAGNCALAARYQHVWVLLAGRKLSNS